MWRPSGVWNPCISAASVAIGSKGVGDLQLGQLGQITIVGDGGSIVLMKVGTTAVMTLVVEPGVELTSLLSEARRTAAPGSVAASAA